MVGYDNRKIAQNMTGVKLDSRLPLAAISSHKMIRNHNILGVYSDLQK